jgi:hypothetical protein
LKASHITGRLLVVSGLCALIFSCRTQLPTNVNHSALQDLSVELDVGSPTENSTDGPYSWITKTDSRFVLVNNTPLITDATLEGALEVSPCNFDVQIKLEATDIRLFGEIGPVSKLFQIRSEISLRPYERRVVKLSLEGGGCQTSPADGRVIFSKISRVGLLKSVAQVDNP